MSPEDLPRAADLQVHLREKARWSSSDRSADRARRSRLRRDRRALRRMARADRGRSAPRVGGRALVAPAGWRARARARLRGRCARYAAPRHALQRDRRCRSPAEQARRARDAVPEAKFVQADFTTLELEPESFDAVVSFYAFNHVPRELLAPTFARIRRWLVPSGLPMMALWNERGT